MENCKLHDIEFKRHLEEDDKHQKAIRESLHEIREILHKLTKVTVKNGGGMPFTYERDVFDQVIYNSMKFKWKDTLKDIAVIASVITAVASAIKAFIL